LANVQAYQMALGSFGLSSIASWVFFMLKNPSQGR
jgi:hypothetical protein